MARDNDKVTEIHAPDFEKMKRIFTRDIKPAMEKSESERGKLSAAWKAIEEECHCNKAAAKLLHKMHGMSEELRDDFLRTLYGGMMAMGIAISADLVDKMGDGEAPQMPVEKKSGAGTENLATLTTH